ncbi:hypothetical protein SOASR031_05960 [Leminorella grimontii]|uniref:autotransporter outer membrane beta-barrel domain-containing protein n=1 Tax=Leminorella grimontii TaxID=82981 RepID=UPI002083BF25|nr:autotransporter outer membrane beta-barrel domain-containing protein [Leminorella grimontii]GKX58281.1 hypothetical protein SOASR031_05960 [Leminorella grimontii]
MRKNYFSQNSLYRQLALLGAIGLGTYTCSEQTKSAELESLEGTRITLQGSDALVADSSGDFAYSVFNSSTGAVSLAQGLSTFSDASVNGENGSKINVAKLGTLIGGDITLQDNDLIVVTDSDFTAIYSSTSGHIDLANGVTINVERVRGGTGIHVDATGNNTTITANALTININNTDTDMGSWGTGIYVMDDIFLGEGKTDIDLGKGSKITVQNGYGIQFLSRTLSFMADGLSIETSGDSGTGIQIDVAESLINLGSGSSITTSGEWGTGIYFRQDDGYSSRFEANKLTITTLGDSSGGIGLDNASYVDLGSNSTITTYGSGSHGIYIIRGGHLVAEALTINVSGANSGGLMVAPYWRGTGGTATIGAGSSILVNKESSVDVEGYGAYAIYVAGSDSAVNYMGVADNRNMLSVSVNSDTGTAIAAQAKDGATLNLAYTDVVSNGVGLHAYSGGVIQGESVRVDSADNDTDVLAVSASEGGQIALGGESVLNAKRAIEAKGTDARVSASGKLTMNGSVVAIENGYVSLNMQSGSVWNGHASNGDASGTLNVMMAGSRWNVTQTSTLNTLTMADATVDLSSQATSNDGFTTLTVADLSGKGTFFMRTDVVGDSINNSGDLLKVTGTSSGSYLLAIKNQGSLAATGNEVLTVVETADGAATFAAASKVELGGYLYDVRKNGTSWELYASGSAPALSSPVTTAADAGANYLNVGYLMNYAENQTLMQRMGDLRQSGERGNVWIRGYGGKFDAFASGKLSGFDMGYSGVQIGADKRISNEIPLSIGLFMGSTHASPDYRGGDGTASSDYMGMYASYMAQGGFYSDLVLKASRQKNSFSVLDSQNNGVNADGSASGFSASLEAGQKFSLNQTGNGFYVEPQAQFTYSHQNAMGMKASNGLNIDLSSYESMLGRASVLLGYETITGNSKLNVYLKTGALREFSGDTDYRLNGSKEKHSFKGNGWNNGLGISAQLNKQHTLYLEADYTSGNAFDQRQVNGGYRFSF